MMNIALLTNTPTQAKPLLLSQEQVARGISLSLIKIAPSH